MPDISPDFSAPGSSGIIQIASWALGLGLIVTLIALVGCFVTIAFKGFGNQGMQQGASKSNSLGVPRCRLLWVHSRQFGSSLWDSISVSKSP